MEASGCSSARLSAERRELWKDARVADHLAYTWPTDFPPGCPPDDVDPAEGVFYRFVRHEPPTPDDFKRPIDTPRYRGEEYKDRCELYALSVYSLIEDAKRAQDLIPAMSKRLIARGDLSPAHGVVSNTPDKHPTEVLWSHHDWWVPLGVEPSPAFAVVS